MQMNEQKIQNITLALAGIFQAATLVRDLAKTGTMNETLYETTISTIYKINADNVADIFNGASGVKLGLKELSLLLSNNKAASDPYIGRYVISLLHLERRLRKNQEMLNQLKRRVNYAISQANYFSNTHPTVIASLADIYLKTLGTLPFRIQVVGQAKYLNQTEVLNKVRALLLAGVRAAVLWRQVGGSRLQLLFARNKLVQMAKQILKEV
jgi:high frequency lysogenization protein